MQGALYRSSSHHRGSLRESDRGFTLIELLIVIVIIGILAAIAVPTFLNQQRSAQDAAAKQDVSNAKVVVISYITLGGDVSTPPTPSTLTSNGFTKSGGTGEFNLRVRDSADPFCVEELSKSGNWFSTTNRTGTIATGRCSSDFPNAVISIPATP